MKFNYVLLAAAAILAVSAETPEECVKSKSCGVDVVCIAHCFNVPAPTTQQVANVESCLKPCNEDINCYSSCIEKEFLGSGTAGAAAAAAGAAAGAADNVADAAANAANTAAGAANSAAGAATSAAGAAGAAATNAAGAAVNNTAANANTAQTTSGASPRAAFSGLIGLICSALYFAL